VVDGLDLFAVYEAAGEAIARARRGEGPSLIEAKTYRYYGHFQGDMVTYRTDDELNKYKQRDAIQSVRNYAIQHGMATAEELDAIDARTREHLEKAWKAAKAAPWPDESELLTDVYVSY
jgi:pyruvate dehydrogenase E1 component alpha subunit